MRWPGSPAHSAWARLASGLPPTALLLSPHADRMCAPQHGSFAMLRSFPSSAAVPATFPTINRV
jgi:hypothetical protein